MLSTQTRTGHYQNLIDSGAWTVSATIPRDGGVCIQAVLLTGTSEQAAEAAGRFPKSVGARAATLSGHDYLDHADSDPRYSNDPWKCPDRDEYMHGWTVGYTQIAFNLISNGVTGGKNETALKRYRSFRKNAVKLGLTVTFEVLPYGNSVQSEADLENLLAIEAAQS